MRADPQKHRGFDGQGEIPGPRASDWILPCRTGETLSHPHDDDSASFDGHDKRRTDRRIRCRNSTEFDASEVVRRGSDSLSLPLVPVGLVFCAGGGPRPPSAAAVPVARLLGPFRD
jgi:hypothetical protein